MATQKINIYYVLGEAKSFFLSPTQSDSYLPFQFRGFLPLSLFLLYLFTLLCLFLCATVTVSYAVYHGDFGQPVKFIDAFKSLSKSLMRLVATFFCAQLLALAGLVVIDLIAFGVTRGIEYLGYETPFDRDYFRVLCLIVLGPLVYSFLSADWVLAAVIVVVESSWGLEPLRHSAYLGKEYNRLVGFRLMFSICVMPCLIMVGFGSWIFAFGSIFYPGTSVAVTIAVGTAILSGHLLHMLITNTIYYIKCKALQGDDKLPDEVIAEDNNRENLSLPLDEEKVLSVV